MKRKQIAIALVAAMTLTTVMPISSITSNAQEASIGTQADTEAPKLINGKFHISPNNSEWSKSKVVTFETNEPIKRLGGWKDISGKRTKWSKKFTENGYYSVTLTDDFGNSTTEHFRVKNIETVTWDTEISYDTKEPTNDTVTVTINTNGVRCATPSGWVQVDYKGTKFEKTYSENVTNDKVRLVCRNGQKSTVYVTVDNIDKVAPKAYVNGTNPIDNSITYDDGVNLKFYDNAALDRYELNDQAGPTSIKGSKWGDGNLQNIKGLLKDGDNKLVVWDMAGNSSEYKFTVDLNIPQTVGVNYYIPAEDRYVEGQIVVDDDATTVDPTTLTDIPEGYEIVSTDAAQINDGWIYVELQQIVTTKEVGVNYYIPAEGRYVEGKIVVDKDATTIDPTTLTDIPEGYELISTDAVQINDNWIYVELQKTVNEAAATLQVNFVGEFGEDIGVAPVVVTKNGPEGEWANFVYGEDWTLPEGYTFAADFDEAAATQTISVKYGETLNSLQIGIVPQQ